MNAAIRRVKDTEATTLAGMEAKLDYLAEVGEDVFDMALDAPARIAERQPEVSLV